jgi:hypothetical protein
MKLNFNPLFTFLMFHYNFKITYCECWLNCAKYLQIEDEAEELISLKSRSAVRQVCGNEAESSFITSPTRSSVSTVGSSRQRRREMTATESPSVAHSAKTDTVEDIHSLRRDKSSTPVSYLSRRNKVAETRRIHLVAVGSYSIFWSYMVTSCTFFLTWCG